MLADKGAMATIAVKNLPVAKKFYGDTLGLKEVGGAESGVATYKSGNSTIVVYESQFAGTNKATSATWGVGGELDSIVETLKKRHVPFEHYDLPGLKLKGDIHVWEISRLRGSRTRTATFSTSTTCNSATAAAVSVRLHDRTPPLPGFGNGHRPHPARTRFQDVVGCNAASLVARSVLERRIATRRPSGVGASVVFPRTPPSKGACASALSAASPGSVFLIAGRPTTLRNDESISTASTRWHMVQAVL